MMFLPERGRPHKGPSHPRSCSFLLLDLAESLIGKVYHVPSKQRFNETATDKMTDEMMERIPADFGCA